jgi:site-specific DNA-cytosine methylase
MVVLSLFDGMSCGRLALEKVGIPVEIYYSSEVDKYAMQVANDNYPVDKWTRLGDVREIDTSIFPEVDLLIGGSPCQSFSFAGKRKGMSTKDDVEILTLEHYLELKAEGFEFQGQSYLFWEYMRILRELKPKYFLLENVVMSKKWERVLSDAIGVEPIMINSSLVSAQNRKRLYWTNIPNVEQPEDKGLTWGDIREHGVETEGYYYTEKAMQWLAIHSRRKNKPLKVHDDGEKMQMIEASHSKKYSSQRFFGIVDIPAHKQQVAAMRGRYLVTGRTQQFIEFRYDGKTNALTTVSKDNVVIPFTLPNKVPVDEFFFRYITPLECERLQTVPDNYTASVSNSQRYKMLGNGWTVDVIAHIFKGLINEQI